MNRRNEAADRLFKAILALESLEECYDFFEDICTIKELESISQRLEVALMLTDRKSYQQICQETGVSSATISRVNRCLNYGSGGYGTAIARLREGDGA